MSKALKSIKLNYSIIWSLAKNDIKSRYLGSTLGSLWIFVLPLVNLTVMWFAFEHGLKAGKQEGVPFLVWLITGLFPWTFFSDATSSASNSIVEKAFLVKKIVFKVELLPLIKIVASLVLFLFLVAVMILVLLTYGLKPNEYWLQAPYYAVCLIALVSSLAWISSSIVVFHRDFGQIINVGLQVGFWATPIFWSADILPERYRFLTFLNPMSYIISGFRSSFITKGWFWDNAYQSIYFWFLILILFFIGRYLFKSLRPHFADVL